ncbi:MAG: ribose 5-phosphate isomerase B [Phycisphaerales bacterium]
MKIGIGADHRGAPAAKLLADKFRREGHEVHVFGECSGASCDYPESAYLVGSAVNAGKIDRGILICGTGIGMSIAANKVKGVRAAVAHDELTAGLSRSHNNANVLCLSADLLGQRLIEKISETFLATEFEGGRHARRVEKISAIERGVEPSSIQ